MVALKLTLVPAQMVVVGVAVMLIVGVTTGLTVMVKLLDVAVVGEAQPSDDVRTHDT